MTEKRSRSAPWLVILAIVTLFNPNINILDILPDFIGYFILARIFLRAADIAPYFEEARTWITRLAYLNLAKIAGLLIIGMARSVNVQDYDIYALVTLLFTAAEIICLIPAIKNTFAALDYLGERTAAVSLISEDGKKKASLAALTYTALITKCALAFIPELFRLTVDTESGTVNLAARLYAPILILCTAVSLIIGIIWLLRATGFARGVIREGLFKESLELLAKEGSYEEFEKKIAIRREGRAFLCFILSAILSFNLVFDNFNNVNLLPKLIFGAIFSVGILGLLKPLEEKGTHRRWAIALLICNSVFGIAAFFFEISFLDNFEYADLLDFKNAEALAAFISYVTSAAILTLIHLGLIALFFFVMKKYTDNLGYINESGQVIANDSYHRALNRKTAALTVLYSLSSLLNLARVILSGIVEVIYFNSALGIVSSMVVSVFPAIGLFANISVAACAIYSVYYFNMLKEERK